MRIVLTTATAPKYSPFFMTEVRPFSGLGYLSAVLKGAGHEVGLVDQFAGAHLDIDYLIDRKIDAVGIYASTPTMRGVRDLLGTLARARNDGAWTGAIIVGGPHASLFPDQFDADVVVSGEGEEVVAQAMRHIEAGDTGVYLLGDRVEDLDALPRIDWDLYDMARYPMDGAPFMQGIRTFNLSTSRGCPQACTFCSQTGIFGRRWIGQSAERIVDDVQYLQEKHGGNLGIYFREDNFTASRKRLERFLSIRVHHAVPWAAEARADSLLDEDLVRDMKAAGCRGLYIGVESGNQKTLDRLRKRTSIDEIMTAFSNCRNAGIKTAASTMVGIPGEDHHDQARTLQLLADLRPDVAWKNIYVGMPGAPLYDNIFRDGQVEAVDPCGIAYLHGHNDRVDAFYSGNQTKKIPPDAEKIQ